MSLKTKDLSIIISYLIVISLFILTLNNSFFWDTIQLGSKHAQYYYKNNFDHILLPNSIDSGHIPAFGMYLCLMWKMFGRNLIVSHLAMLPFVLGSIWQLYKLTRRFIPDKYAGLALLMILSDPTLLSQFTLISPDVILVFFCVLGINSLLQNSKILLSVSIFFLFLTSMRGMMVSFCLLIIDILVNISFSNTAKHNVGSVLKRSLIYLPAFFIFIAFSFYHYIDKGWIGFHENSPWAELFEKVGFTGILFNICILGWRIIDFGRFGIWVVFFILLFKFKMEIFKLKGTRLLTIIFLVFLIFLAVNMIWAKNLLAHRYLLPIYLIFSLLCANILFTQLLTEKFRRLLIVLWMLILISGNFWIYPDKIAKGWDSTLGHLPYYKIRRQALTYLDEQKIDFKNVQSFFPNTGKIDDIDLNNDTRFLTDFNNTGDFVLYSNVFNISDENFDLIKTQYTVIKQFRSGLINMDICKRRY
jgi:hypothetical protein